MNISNPKIKIRAAQKTDWPKIIEIYNQAVLESGKTADTEPQSVEGRKEWLDQHLNPKYPILLAEIDSQIVGWCSLSPHRKGRKALEITAEISYYIDKENRSVGVGKTLIQSAINYAKSNSIKNVFAILLDVNVQSIKILEHFGFEKWGHLPDVAQIDELICGQFIYGKHI